MTLPQSWKSLILCYTAPVNRTPTLQFSITGPSSPTPPNIERQSTHAFYLDLLHLSPHTIPALQQWSNSLLPQPVFNTAFWKNIYTPYSFNKHCDKTWKIAHHNLPTALSLYHMAVYPTTQCPHCNSVETIEHLLLHCPNLLTFWSTISTYINKITQQVAITPTLQLFGYICKNRPLSNRAVYLLNRALTLARYAINKSATEYRLRSTIRERSLTIGGGEPVNFGGGLCFFGHPFGVGHNFMGPRLGEGYNFCTNGFCAIDFSKARESS